MKRQGRMPINYSICLYEVSLIIDLYLQYRDWAKVKEEVMKDNLMQRKKATTCAKMLCELRGRISELSIEEMRIFQTANSLERTAIIWLSICRHYPLVSDFWASVIIPKIESSGSPLSRVEVIWFVQEAHSVMENANFSDKSREVMGETMVRIFRDAGMIDSKGNVSPISLTRSFVHQLTALNPTSLNALPVDTRSL